MFVLDTNLLSEPMRPQPDPAVMGWLDRHPSSLFYLPTICLAELLTGIAFLPRGRRRTELESGLAEVLSHYLGPRLLAFDEPAARLYPRLVAAARRRGRAVSTTDAQIAAVAAACGYTVATRDTAPFEAAGVPTVNPWAG